MALDQNSSSITFTGHTARSAKQLLTQAFLEGGVPLAVDDALELILAATGFDKTALMLRGTEALSPDVFETLQDTMARRLSGEPVDHILGWREFFGRRFKISKAVLSPRADTETLIRGALSRLPKNQSLDLIDLGTGSGAIGLTLLAELEHVTLLATDLSKAALKIAKSNAEALDVANRVTFSSGAWWDAVPKNKRFDMILSNPPYITNAAMEDLEPEVKDYDPDLALRGGEDGLDPYREIVEGAQSHLKTDGWIGFEIGFDQGEGLKSILSPKHWSDVTIDRDLGGYDRVVWAQKQG